MEVIPQCFQSSTLHLTFNDTTLVFHFLKIIGMALGYQGSSCHYINVAPRAVERIVEASQSIGTIVQGTIHPSDPLLLAIHAIPPLKDSMYVSVHFLNVWGTPYKRWAC